MWIRLLKLAAKRPLLALALFLSVTLGVMTSAVLALVSHDTLTDGRPRLVLGRPWFDRFPTKATDEVDLWIWLGGGFGVHDKGSVWRSTVDVFEFERQTDKLSMVYLQDNKTLETHFKITECDEQPPFNLCLNVSPALGGLSRYYSFGDLDEMNARIPWAKATLGSADARARGWKRSVDSR
jgi:hypothetical protein